VGSAALRQKAVQVTRQFDEAIRNRLARWSSDVIPIVCIGVAVLIANGPALLHLVTANPLVINAYLTPAKSGWLPGLPYIDPNAGFTSQALGHLAALDWLHGHIPWWNPFEGIGTPLAGEMQSGAFFPLTLVLALQQGMLILQILLEVITGWGTYALAKRLGIGRTFSTAAGVAFGLCGTYAWLAHSPIRPVALLPLSLLGVEQALDAARAHRRGGWQLLALALALSILAAFPETTLIDGIFVAWWAVLRTAGSARAAWRGVLARVVGGGAVGLALAAPLVVAFTDYLPRADKGSLTGGFTYVSLSPSGLTQLVLPYSLGPIFGFHTSSGVDTLSLQWGSVGGFLTVTTIAAGLVGLVGTRLRPLRIGLGAWILVCLLRTYGFPPVVHLLAIVPGVKNTAFYRYAPPTWELAVVILAVLGLDDIARAVTDRRTLVIGTAVTALLGAWAAITAWPLLTNAAAATPSQGAHRHLYAVVSLGGALVLLVLLLVGGWLAAGRRARAAGAHSAVAPPDGERSRRLGRLLAAGVVGLESVLLVGFTYLSAPTPTPLQTGSVAWLQAHLGTYRFATLGPIQPNYGSYFGIAQINIDDLPSPKAWTAYIAAALDPNAPAHNFSGGNAVSPTGLTPAEALTKYLADYEAVGVRYVVENSDGLDLKGQPFPAVGSPPWPAGPRLVYRDGFAEIWQLPSPSAAFSLVDRTTGAAVPTGPGCAVVTQGWDQATVHCDHPSILERRVEYFPGWKAHGTGVSPVVRQDDGSPGRLFQEVSVPAGTTTVRFSYLPPHSEVAVGLAVLAAIVLVGSLVFRRRTRKSPGTVDEEQPTADLP
jgi:hypothetical protein